MTQPLSEPQRPDEPRTVREGRQRQKERVRAVQQAAEGIPDEGYAVRTRSGLVHIDALTFGKEGEVEWADVHLRGLVQAGDPHFRIFNPPALVQDPAGDIELRGVRYRRDPLVALAEVVGQYGGAQTERKDNR